ncbi:hypothetical protein Tco_0367141 [Tanacetum coccineum]
MDNPNITMEEYTRLEKENALKFGKVYNWETAKYGKVWYDEDINDLRSVETEFPAVVFNDKLTFEETLLCEPKVSSLNNNEIDFRISFDDSDDEDYTDLAEKSTMLVKNLRSGILKCWSLETLRRLFNTILLNKSTWRIYRANSRGVFSF